MRMHDPRQYLAARGFHENCVIECSVCPKTFLAKDGVAFPAQNNGEPIMGYFCSEVCYLAAIPVEICFRA
jgi:hypothetical protein